MKKNNLIKIARDRTVDRGTLPYDTNIIKEINHFTNEEMMEIVLFGITKDKLCESIVEADLKIKEIENELDFLGITSKQINANIDNIKQITNIVLDALIK